MTDAVAKIEKPEAEHPPAHEPKPTANETTKAVHNQPPEQAKEPEHQGPNLVKAMIIFLVINGVFAALGTLAYFAYRWKKKKAAASSAENDEDQEDERKAA